MFKAEICHFLFEFDPMTLMVKFDLDIVKILDLILKNEVPSCSGSKGVATFFPHVVAAKGPN